MNRILLFFAAIVLASGCKSASEIREARATRSLPAREIAARHFANAQNYRTLYIKSSARFEDDRQTHNVSAEIRVLKDEKILVSVRFFGITMAKALITPEKVQYYSKPESEYFEGDYSTLSRWLGTDLDYIKVQNLLTGLAMDNLSQGEYASSLEDGLYKLSKLESGTMKAFLFEASRMLIKRQMIDQPAKNRSLAVRYPSHTPHDKAILPAAIEIDAHQDQKKTSIKINYTGVSFDEDLSFPYSVPGDYQRIFID